jgi:hypothetical protein
MMALAMAAGFLRGISANSTRIVADSDDEEESWHFKVLNPACQISVRDERR